MDAIDNDNRPLAYNIAKVIFTNLTGDEKKLSVLRCQPTRALTLFFELGLLVDWNLYHEKNSSTRNAQLHLMTLQCKNRQFSTWAVLLAKGRYALLCYVYLAKCLLTPVYKYNFLWFDIYMSVGIKTLINIIQLMYNNNYNFCTVNRTVYNYNFCTINRTVIVHTYYSSILTNYIKVSLLTFIERVWWWFNFYKKEFSF